MSKRLPAKDELISAYLTGLELTVICLMLQPDDDRATFEMAPWPGPQQTEKSKPVAGFTFAKSGHAELVMAKCAHIAIAPDVALRAFHIEVAAVGAEWRTTAQIIESAEKAVEEIERHVAALNVSGGLSALNAGYKSYRLAMQATGEPAIKYWTYLHDFKIKIVKRVAENVAAGAEKFSVGRIIHSESRSES